MKILFILSLLIFTAALAPAQPPLDSKDLTNLVAISELYSKNPNLNGEGLAKTLDSLRTPRLNTIVDTLVATGDKNGRILDTQFLARPSDDDLLMWYVIREIHYNQTNEKKKPRTNLEVAKEILSKKIDPRWLVDNYYYRIRGGVAFYFNSADLSKRDIKIGALGLRDKTERAIFFLNMMDVMGGGRFMVLMMTRNSKKILEFVDHFPTFDGKKYYHFKDFDYPDFEWIGYEETEWYNARHLDRFFITLLAHHKAESELRDKSVAADLFRSSILNEPKYFKSSEAKDTLQSLYNSYKASPKE